VANEALRRALAERRMTPAELARKVGVDPKTVARWLANEARLPHPRHRFAVCEILEVDEAMIWPLAVRAAVKTGPDREIHRVYPTHGLVPKEVWQHVISGATRELTLFGYAPYWLAREVRDLEGILRRSAAAGVRIRVITGDPDNPIVAADEASTGLPLTLTSRIQQTRRMLEPLRDLIEVRQSVFGYGRSVYRGDDEALVDWWVHGTTGDDFPVLHLRRQQDGGMFDQVLLHAEKLWQDATPVWPEAEDRTEH